MQMIEEKKVLRKKYKLLREKAKSFEKDEKILNFIYQCETFKNADTIYVYYSVLSEVDTHKIISRSLFEGKKVAVPKCTDKNGSMEFYFIKDTDTSLFDGVFSLKEPDASVCVKAVSGKNNLCIVPALSFDSEGYRLGYGGGYYDRFLSNFKGSTIGLCYEECLCEKLPRDTNDIKVDMIITDKKIYELK